MAGLKRKARGSDKPAKKQRVIQSDQLKWKPIPLNAGMQEGTSILGFEEIEGVDVEYNTDGVSGFKRAKFIVDEDAVDVIEEEEEPWVPVAEQGDSDSASPEDEDEPKQKQTKPQQQKREQNVASFDNTPFEHSRPLGFSQVDIGNPLCRSLVNAGFKKPTAIQQAAWKTMLLADGQIAPKDIIGVAETGSGKTLAYGLPIIQSIINHLLEETQVKKPSALILAPTRELALQVRDHLVKLVQGSLKPSSPPLRSPISIVALTGGISIQKQRRQLAQGADIIIATPGRCWDLAQELPDLNEALRNLDFLVLDEADRMIEGGHYAELEKIFRLTNRTKATVEDEFDPDEADTHRQPNDTLRTYVFSATMSKELQKNLKKPKNKRRKLDRRETGKLGALEELLQRLDFRDEDPTVVDLLPVGGIVKSVKEAVVECMVSDKDMHLYHFLLRYPGKTLVFLSSIDGIRRLHPLLSQLQLGSVSILHSGMQQRARLKALERFQKADRAVLLATDVAARGLDVPQVHHVVHYQLPRTVDTYIHRSGRTGRAGKNGVVLQLVAPEEKGLQRELLHALQKDAKDLLSLPIEWSIMDQLKKRIQLAKQIDQVRHRATKENFEEGWLASAAEAMELDVDDLSSDDERKAILKNKDSNKVQKLKAELAHELSRPLVIHGISSRYITQGGQAGFVDSLLDNSNHEQLIGLKKVDAYEEVAAPTTASAKPKPQPKSKGANARKSGSKSKQHKK